MFASSWLRQLQRRWFGRRPIRIVRRRPQHVRPRLETLEDRTLLTAPSAFTVGSLTGSAGQFPGFTDLSATKFLGTDFNVNGGFGSFTNGWGIGANLNVNGKVGFDASYDVSGGNVSATYNNLALSQNYVEPTQVGQQVAFTPQNTNVSYGTGTFSTTSPQAGVGLALDAAINGSISGGLELAGKLLGGSTTFGGSVNQSLISFDSVNGLEVGGKPISSLFSAGGGNVSASGGAVTPTASIPIEIAPGISISLTITPNSTYTGLSESLDLNAGLKEATSTAPSVDGSVNLGTANEQLPNIALSSSSLQSDNTLTDTESSSVANLNLQMGPLAAALLGFPEAGALVSTDTISIGPLSLSITPISFTMGPSLNFVQTGSITPTNQLTYNFYQDNVPDFNTPTVSSSGGSLAAGTYYYTMTSTSANGESLASTEVSATTTGSSSAVTLSWALPTGATATGFKIYRGTSPGAEDTLIATVSSGNPFSFTDDGTETTSTASPPIAGAMVPPVNTPKVSSSGGSLAAGTYYYTVTSTSANGESVASNEASATTTGSASSVALSWGQVAGATGYKVYRGTSAGAENTLLATIGSGSTLTFTDDGTEATSTASPPTVALTPMSLDVTKDGTALNNVNSVTFTPGVDTVAPTFEGNPILVVPTWTTGLNYSNEIDLDVSLQGTLTVLQLTGSASLGPISGSFTLGPLYQKTWDFHDWKLATVYPQNTFSIASQSETLPSFVIGDTFHPDLTVKYTGDENLPGYLRYAVTSANLLGAHSNTPEVIQLGPGTYNLTIASNGTDDGTSGDLDVTGENVIIQGAGAGQTIINAAGLGDRIFDVNAGAGLTLEGVTLENGHTNSTIGNHNNLGGAVYNSGTLTIDNSVLKDNFSSSGGGAIYNSGTMKITNSELDNNSTGTDGVGGAVYNSPGRIGGPVTISDTTFSGNSALEGGGIFSSAQTQLTILNSTIYGNNASNQAGGLYLNDENSNTLINDTITGNRANTSGSLTGTSNGGGIYLAHPTVNTFLGNTVVTDNYDGSTGTTPDDINGTAVDATSSNNLIGTGGSGGLIDGNNGNLVGDDNVGLGTFGNTGGSTQTVQLLPRSLAIDKGSDALAAQYGLLTDQRGYSRIVNGTVDIGAVEYQYDLVLDPDILVATSVGKVEYLIEVLNNGPDPVAGATLTVPLPQGIVFESATAPQGWTETDPGAGNNGTVTFTDTADLNSGDFAFPLKVFGQVQNTTVGANLTSTVTVSPTPWDTHLQNNSAPVTVTNEQEGQTFDNVELLHFTDAANPNATASNFTVEVDWGDFGVNYSYDGSGTVSVVADPNGGFDVLGSHAFAEEGQYSDFVYVTSPDGTVVNHYEEQLFNVADAPLTKGPLTPPANATINQPISNPALTNTVLYHFSDATNPNATASDFTASVNWGDGHSNTSSDNTGTVSVVADPNGGFDVVGISHTYAQPGSFGISVSVTGSDGTSYNQPNAFTFNNGALLFHFTDANPNAGVSDFTATVNWGDGNSNTSSDPTGNVFVVANPNGGFDVYGLHTYTQIVNPGTFTVTVNDVGGAITSASDTNFQVLNPDKPLTAGTLNVPSVTIEGQSISNQLLFQFTDADPNAQASDYLATVSWGDGTFDNSSDGSNSVQVQQISTNPDGSIVFGVYGSHTYSEGSSYFAVKVTDLGDPRSSTPDAGGQVVSAGSSTLLTITDPALANVTASTISFSASEGSMSTVQTLATFTDPGGPESDNNAYIAIIQWGDGSVTATNLAAQANYTQASVNSQGQITENTGNVISTSNVAGIVLGSDGQTFSVNLAHQYAEEGPYTITITLNHDGILSQPVTVSANVTDPAVMVKAASSFSATEGVASKVQTVATFTDPGGPESDANAYTATIDWGDNTTTSTATLGNGGIVLGSDGQTFSVNLAHQYADEGTYTITITLNHDGVLSAPVTIIANVADNDNLTATGGTPLTGTYGTASLSGVTVATFTDTYTGNTASDFAATIDWGDGTPTSSGTISGSNGNFTVTGSHNYSAANTTGYSIVVTINDDGAGTATATANTTAIINKLAATITGSRTYDGTNTAAASILTITNVVGGDTVSLSPTGYATLASANAGPETISDFSGLSLTGASAGNYTLTGASGSVTINPLAMTLSGTRPYDGTNTAAASILTITNAVSGDTVSLSGSATLAGANVGTQTITDFTNLSLQGTSQGNYTLTGASGTVTITPATLTVTPIIIGPTAGAPITSPIATITNNVDPNNGNDYTAVINWGDGTATSTGTITGNGTTLTVTGSHTYSTPNTYTVTVTISNNQGNTTPVTINETITVTSLDQGVVNGLTGTIGFWNNKNGQALIDSFNGGPNSTALANWLASTFPNLYANLAGDSNTQVAAYFQALFNQSSGPKAQAQTLAVALNVYATTLSLGETAAVAYGFTVSADGLGAYSFNVGSDGAAFGVANNTTLNVYQLLLAVNSKAVNGVLSNGDTTLQSEVADLFGNLNQAGDI